MSFDYKKFRDKITQNYGNTIDEAIINEILELGDESDYSRDTPISTGKRLILVDLTLKGTKSDGERIDFFQEFMQGVNIIIADNFKGKSSLFKAIQFALTGNDNLKHDIKKWLNTILLNFKINDQAYCIYMNTESSTLHGSLYATKISSIEEIELLKIPAIFNERGVEKFSKEMELFFFNQFSYYSLKWTQKSSQKNSNKLLEANASWRTYFKSIFLESKDTNLGYGAQEKKIFQMLLGLKLTYPINRLKIKKDMKEFEKARRADSNEFRSKPAGTNKKELAAKLNELNAAIQQLRLSREDATNFDKYSEHQKNIISQISQENKAYLREQSEIRELHKDLYLTEDKCQKIEQELSRTRKNVLQISKSIQDLQEFLDVGRLFSNLEIKYCPCCNKKVSSLPVSPNESEVECILCHDIIDSNEENENQLKYVEKIEKLNQDKQQLLQFQMEEQSTLEELQKQRQIQKVNIDASANKSKTENFRMLALQEELAKLGISLAKQQNKTISYNEQLESLIYQKAIVDFQLEQPSIETGAVYNDSLENQIAMLEFAISLLEKERYNLGRKVLSDLSKLMLEELHLFGLTTITEIQISENFDISYKQDGDFVQFDKIAEGEQLRVKISLYLSLIQLDVKYNFGKHTRFLIIDSPSKEEGDSVYLEGLSTLLKGIENRFKGELQIFIGTAERKLSGIVTNETILEHGEFLF
jgi:AAA domain